MVPPGRCWAIVISCLGRWWALTRENLLEIAVTADEPREVNVHKVCIQPLNGSEFTVHVDVAACRISGLKSQIRAE